MAPKKLVLAVAVAVLVLGSLVAGSYFQVLGGSKGQGTASSSSSAGVSSLLGNSVGLRPSWLANDPAIVGNTSKIDYPPDYGVLANFTLAVINSDRQAAGLLPVALSSIPSGQQHADSMAYYGYFSHWDNQGYKPYMRYSLLGGTGSVEENLALNYCSQSQPGEASPPPMPCSLATEENAINSSEWGMMNNDTACCDNGHRLNILGPIHNRVSVGIAYNATTMFLVEDFEDSYVTSPSITLSSGVVNYSGRIPDNGPNWLRNPSGEEITVYFDPIPKAIGAASLALTPSCGEYSEQSEPAQCKYQGAYDPGVQATTVFAPCPGAAVCASGNYTYANSWTHNSGTFDVVFSIASLESTYGNGVYTLYLWPGVRAPEAITSISLFVNGAQGSAGA